MFRFLSSETLNAKVRKLAEQLDIRQSNVEVANSVTFVTLAEKGDIDDVTAVEHTDLFTQWVVGTDYKVGDLRQYEEALYRCVQAHKSQADWTPDVTASLWKAVGNPTEEYPEWSQPVGSHDAYQTGDKVSYNNKHWQSTANNNVWQPGVYGWEEIQ